ncbi:FHA domain-containing protein [Massilia agilis]|uniref:FHA domain-containing protein n=1 Tax=Massilia agilis TaxID=1811226 RepID=A0ABT2DBX5_9BURK|nr:FHA domain-containing protein [Massilia agilis]MCS0807918.1 FHA domain-containing protein [Massilia agilis]
MNLCRDPDHPHCTVWVMPGGDTCAHGHPQPPPQAAPVVERQANSVPARPHLHVSGFDPRAAGGRQAIKLDLRGMPGDCPPRLTMLLKSALHLYCPQQQTLARAADGNWCPAFIEFSSRGIEHGQHRIEVELHGRAGAASRTWVCSLVVLVPRADATLSEIHQAFLSSHKNVRVFADESSIARVNAHTTSGTVDIDVAARNAGIARLELDATTPGPIQLGLPTIAWDEELVEISLPDAGEAHPYPADAASIVSPQPTPGMPRHLRLFAATEWTLGRFDALAPAATVLLAHHPATGAGRDALTRRLSAHHAAIRAAGGGFTIEDVSRFGLLIDGEWPGKGRQVPLREGMRIELTASVRGIVELQVAALLPHVLVLARVDGGALAESFCLVVPGSEPAPARPALPPVFHRAGGFWHRDPATGLDTPLAPATALDRLACMPARARFAGGPYPETWSVRARVGDRRRAPMLSPA